MRIIFFAKGVGLLPPPTPCFVEVIYAYEKRSCFIMFIVGERFADHFVCSWGVGCADHCVGKWGGGLRSLFVEAIHAYDKRNGATPRPAPRVS